jgi:hypothetical protein
VAVAGEKPGGRDADHTAAENQNPHGMLFARVWL